MMHNSDVVLIIVLLGAYMSLFPSNEKFVKNPKKPNSYPEKGNTGIGFFWVFWGYTPPVFTVFTTDSVYSVYNR